MDIMTDEDHSGSLKVAVTRDVESKSSLEGNTTSTISANLSSTEVASATWLNLVNNSLDMTGDRTGFTAGNSDGTTFFVSPPWGLARGPRRSTHALSYDPPWGQALTHTKQPILSQYDPGSFLAGFGEIYRNETELREGEGEEHVYVAPICAECLVLFRATLKILRDQHLLSKEQKTALTSLQRSYSRLKMWTDACPWSDARGGAPKDIDELLIGFPALRLKTLEHLISIGEVLADSKSPWKQCLSNHLRTASSDA